MITRQTRNNGETQGEETIVSNEIESKETNFTSLVRKLAYFNRSSVTRDRESDEAIDQWTQERASSFHAKVTF